jgi:hypothetical protein
MGLQDSKSATSLHRAASEKGKAGVQIAPVDAWHRYSSAEQDAANPGSVFVWREDI